MRKVQVHLKKILYKNFIISLFKMIREFGRRKSFLKYNIGCIKMERLKLSIFILFIQCFLFILFVAFGVYTLMADGSSLGNSISPIFGGFNHQRFNIVARFYPMFQDIHVMIFVGFGFLMVFLRKYGYSSVGFNFLLAALTLQWTILCQGFFELNDDYKIEIGLTSLYRADIATAVVLISMGAVLGRISQAQLIVMGILEIAAYCINNHINSKFFKAVDVGGSVLVHTFGAYFGLAVSYVTGRKHRVSDAADRNNNQLLGTSYISNILAMIGTIFLWVYWPSFNAIDLENDKAHRAIINTYLSLTASCVIAFAASQITSKDHKFNMVHIQNSTLAGGVAIGASTQLMVQPFGAILIGMIAGAISVYGYTSISQVLEHRFGIQDTCGVHNLHGIPGILGGFTAVILSSMATEAQYGKTLYEVYPARANPVISQNPEYIPLEAGDGRTAGQQAGYQMILVVVTVAISIVSGIISGFIINLGIWSHVSPESFYDDEISWELPYDTTETENLQVPEWKFKEKIYNNSNPHLSKISI